MPILSLNVKCTMVSNNTQQRPIQILHFQDTQAPSRSSLGNDALYM